DGAVSAMFRSPEVLKAPSAATRSAGCSKLKGMPSAGRGSIRGAPKHPEYLMPLMVVEPNWQLSGSWKNLDIDSGRFFGPIVAPIPMSLHGDVGGGSPTLPRHIVTAVL